MGRGSCYRYAEVLVLRLLKILFVMFGLERHGHSSHSENRNFETASTSEYSWLSDPCFDLTMLELEILSESQRA